MTLRMAISFLACLMTSAALAQGARPAMPPPDSYDGHLAAAKQAAGFDFTGTLARLCVAPWTSAGGGGGKNPPRAEWYAEPVKVFDNLYWLGTKVHSAWALTDKAGIIVIDTLYNYAAEPEIVEGMRKMHLDPKTIKYVIVSHGHGDHDEGAKLLQDLSGAHIVMGAADWDAIGKTAMPGGTPKKDLVASDGQKITVGANTVTIVTTPGHTPGTLSFLFTVHDHGKPMVVAYSGGTSNIPLVHDVKGLTQYIDSQRKMAKAAAAAGASIVMSNHSEFDNAYTRTRLLAVRKAGEPHPYDLGTDGVQRYFKMAAECAQATRMKAQGEH